MLMAYAPQLHTMDSGLFAGGVLTANRKVLGLTFHPDRCQLDLHVG
jgi:hypothetical protein